MNELIGIATTGLIRAVVTQYSAWLERKAKDAAWKPSDADVEEFLNEIAADSPEALKAKVAATLGLPWPPK